MTDEGRADAPATAEDLPARMDARARKIGHDLNNCLGVVGGRAELVLMQLGRGNTEGARKGVEVILDQMTKMGTLTESLRHLQKPE